MSCQEQICVSGVAARHLAGLTGAVEVPVNP